MAALPPALWLCSKQEEVEGQSQVGVYHLNIWITPPLPWVIFSQRPHQKHISCLNIIANNCVTFHNCAFRNFGTVAYVSILLNPNHHSDTIQCNKEQINRNAKSTFMPQQIACGTPSSPRKVAHCAGPN